MSSLLIDATNFDDLAPKVINQIAAADFIGLDCETEDSRRHDGLNQYCKYNAETGMKAKNTKTVFDMRRTTMTGFSLCTEGNDPIYVNLNHKDFDNRVPFDKAYKLLEAKKPDAHWLAHNAPFELTAFKSCYGIDLKNIICTLQMCVSAYGPHEYPHDKWMDAEAGAIGQLLPRIAQQTANGFDPNKMTPELSEIVYKIIAKESDAAHSWNGFVDQLTYGYGLKDAVWSHFGHRMTTFEEVLNGKAHMGELTGAEVASYGGEDAYWVLPLFRHLLAYMAQVSPSAIEAFFKQENPMAKVYSQIWTNGMRVKTGAILSRRAQERQEFAAALRRMKLVIRDLLPFEPAPNEDLMKFDAKWYAKGYPKYRAQIEDWANSPDSDDDYQQAQQVRGAVSNAWATESGNKESTGLNLSHYMPMRVMLYDLARAKHVKADGKTQSDGEARGKIKDKNPQAAALVDSINTLAQIEQRMKLYLTPYSQLMDPETGRMYPTVSSMLATRRLGCSTPNGMQLAKRGPSRYVRGFFEADTDDHLIVSIDWSGIELVEIGEFSGDPEFIKAFGQIPHADLHSGAASDILSVECGGLNESIFKDLKKVELKDDFIDKYRGDVNNLERLFINLKGEPIKTSHGGPKGVPSEALKYWRTEVGKGANFNYWYSGWLGTIGERMGWSDDTTKTATEKYRERFAIAENWRLNLISQVQRDGYITLRDGHRHVRYEATDAWFLEWMTKFGQNGSEGYAACMSWIGNKIRKRAFNQTVNADIQGSCATIAKRSIMRTDELIEKKGWDARFMLPIHDELLWSVHKDLVPEFVFAARGVMIDHPDLFKLCKLDASPAVGKTFEPWSDHNGGQIELFEPPKELGLGTDRLDQTGVKAVVDYLFSR